MDSFVAKQELKNWKFTLDQTCVGEAGGWATEIIGAMPVAFDAFDYEHYTILVKEVDENHRISRLLILKHKTNEEDED